MENLMKYITAKTNPGIIKPGKANVALEVIVNSSRSRVSAKGVATVAIASGIIQTGKGIISAIAKHLFVKLSPGNVTAYFAHKRHRKIISISNRTAKQSKHFVLDKWKALRSYMPCLEGRGRYERCEIIPALVA
jgi:hypothetical protein